MADIRVVRDRKRGLGWLWAVLLLLVVLGVAYWLWSTGRLGGTAPASTQSAPTSSLVVDVGHRLAA